MGRWDISDDARSLEQASARTPERTETIHHDHDLQITPLPDRVSPRSRDDLGEGREHHLTLPDGREREEVRESGRVYHLRGSEVDLRERTGRFRVTFTDDLKHDSGHAGFDEDLRSLKERGQIDERTVTHFREGTVADVVSVRPAGQSLLDHHRDPDHDQGQVYYGGWVKLSEVWHDARLFRMVCEVESELAREGASVQRVVLDDELKADAFRALHEARSKGETDSARIGRWPRPTGCTSRTIGLSSRSASRGSEPRRDRAHARSRARHEGVPPRTSERKGGSRVPHVRGRLRQLAWRDAHGSTSDRTVAPMTADLDRCHALEMLGYTARQAQFLVHVALHGGYFLRRQYLAFTGTAHGQATFVSWPAAWLANMSGCCPTGETVMSFICVPGRCTPQSAKRTIATGASRSGMPSSAS